MRCRRGRIRPEPRCSRYGSPGSRCRRSRSARACRRGRRRWPSPRRSPGVPGAPAVGHAPTGRQGGPRLPASTRVVPVSVIVTEAVGPVLHAPVVAAVTSQAAGRAAVRARSRPARRRPGPGAPCRRYRLCARPGDRSPRRGPGHRRHRSGCGSGPAGAGRWRPGSGRRPAPRSTARPPPRGRGDAARRPPCLPCPAATAGCATAGRCGRVSAADREIRPADRPRRPAPPTGPGKPVPLTGQAGPDSRSRPGGTVRANGPGEPLPPAGPSGTGGTGSRSGPGGCPRLLHGPHRTS